MRINHEKAKELARRRGRSLTSVLRDAGVSRTAYYSLASKPSVLPRSVRLLAEALDVDASHLLVEVPTLRAHERRLARARAVCNEHGEAEFQNIWHTLVLLDLPPMERLNRSLRRGRTRAVHS